MNGRCSGKRCDSTAWHTQGRQCCRSCHCLGQLRADRGRPSDRGLSASRQQSARLDVATRENCTRSPKVLSIAFHDSAGKFPRGLYDAAKPDPNWSKYEEDGLGWATKILPQLEESAIYDRLVRNGISGYDGNLWQAGIFDNAKKAGKTPLAGGETVLCTFQCPSVDLPSTVPNASWGDSTGDRKRKRNSTFSELRSGVFGLRGLSLAIAPADSTDLVTNG